MPLPLSDKDNNALAEITPDSASLGIWLDVVVAQTNEYKDDKGNLLNYVADLTHREQGIGRNIFFLIITFK